VIGCTPSATHVRFGGACAACARPATPDSRIGVYIEELPAGRQSAPLHYHLREVARAIIERGRDAEYWDRVKPDEPLR
jgi:hypothetical protein